MSTVTGLPAFRRGELANVKAGRVVRERRGIVDRPVNANGGFVAVVIAEIAGRITLATTGDPNRWGRNLASEQGQPVRVVSLLWTVSTLAARRVRDMAAATLVGRRIGDGETFDVPDHLATAAVEIAGRKVGLPTWDTAGLMKHLAKEHDRRVATQMVSKGRPLHDG